jgi:hypothetical protein
MNKLFTLVRLKRDTAERLKQAGKKGESYDTVINDLMNRAEMGE